MDDNRFAFGRQADFEEESRQPQGTGDFNDFVAEMLESQQKPTLDDHLTEIIASAVELGMMRVVMHMAEIFGPIYMAARQAAYASQNGTNTTVVDLNPDEWSESDVPNLDLSEPA